MKTGEDVRVPGLYASECCVQEALFDTGECYSRCPHCTNLCDWEVIDIKSSSTDFRVLKEKLGIGKIWAKRPEFNTGAFRYSL